MIGKQAKYYFIAIICLLLVSGCSSKPELVLEADKPLPEWYLNPPANSNNLLIGTGGGKSLEEATESALSNLVARLGVSIESKYESITESTKYTYANKSIEYIKSEVAKIRISNYELVFSEKIKYNQFVAMVQSDRNNFIKDLTQQIDDKIASEKNKIKVASKDHALKRYLVTREAAHEVEKLEPAIIILSGMDKNFDNVFYQKEIQNLQSQSELARRNIAFVIKTDSLSRKASTPIKNALSQQGYRVTSSASGDGAMFIHLETYSQRNRSMGFQIAELLVNIKVTDYQGRLIGSNSLGLTGHATRGYDMAESAAIEELEDVISKQGISKVLGLAL